MASMGRRANVIDVNQFRLFGPGRWITPRHQPKRFAKTLKYFGSPMRWVNVPDGGWHFTFMNGPEAVSDKLFHYPHAIPDKDTTLENAQTRIKNALDHPEYKVRQLDDQFPNYLCRNVDRFRHMLIPPSMPARADDVIG